MISRTLDSSSASGNHQSTFDNHQRIKDLQINRSSNGISTRSRFPRNQRSKGSKPSGTRAGRPTAPIGSIATRSRDRGLLDRYAAADGQRLAARRPCVLVHAHRCHRAVSADARQGGVLSDGVGRQRTADRAARAELLRRALRSVAAVRPGVPAARASRASSRSRCRGRTSSSCATG